MTSTTAPTVLGIDIGGTGIKGAPVEVRRGTLATERFRLLTPQPATPDAVVKSLREIVEKFTWHDRVGVTFPGVVQGGVVRTAANMDKSWVGTDFAGLIKSDLGLSAYVLNDADAAGLAEVAHGAAKRVRGVVLVVTFGTGVGSGLFVDGRLVPNTELGHVELDGRDAEKRVAESVREAKKLSWKKWTRRVNDYLAELEELFSPDLFVVGGGIAKKPDQFLPLLKTRAPVRVAALGNEAGIVGAAMAANQQLRVRSTRPGQGTPV